MQPVYQFIIILHSLPLYLKKNLWIYESRLSGDMVPVCNERHAFSSLLKTINRSKAFLLLWFFTAVLVYICCMFSNVATFIADHFASFNVLCNNNRK